jgi:diguanylate cyclase (GGDEF)-like protein/PAS domain S-box-containing protein
VIESWNRAAQHLFGYTAAEAVGEPGSMLVPPERRREHDEILGQIRRGEPVEPLETVRITKAGRRMDVGRRMSLLRNADGELIGASSISRDITQRVRMERALRAAEHRFHTAFDRAPIGICLLPLDAADAAALLEVYPAMAELLGHTVDGLTGTQLSALTAPEDHARIRAKLGELAGGQGGQVEFEGRLIHHDGHVVWAQIRGALLSEADEQQTVAITHVIDISDRKRSEDQLQHLADHDALTGLVNRRPFTEELAGALRLGKRHGEAGAVLFLDLDGFKFVNDTFGHAAGDELIVRVAGLLSGAIRKADTIARIGGDEFAILLTRCDRVAAILVAEKPLSTLRHDNQSNGDDPRMHVSSSVGIALFAADDGLTPDELVVRADIAMYEAKNSGNDRCSLYDCKVRRRA